MFGRIIIIVCYKLSYYFVSVDFLFGRIIVIIW